MKEVLEYTEDELNNLSLDELKLLLREANDGESKQNSIQMAEKVTINSLYGAFSNRWFPLFNEDMAGAITGNGRYFIQKSANLIEDTLQKLLPENKPYIIYGDTDSFYFQIEPFMNKYQEKNPGLSMNEYVDWADSFEKKIIAPAVQKSIDEFATELNAFNPEIIGCSREAISDCGIFSGKKKYFMRVRDNEGTRYPESDPYIKVMGLEIIKSSTPLWSKKHLKNAIPHILDKDENDLRDWVNNIKTEFTKVDLNQIAAVGGVSNLDYVLGSKGIPFGSKAALIHNQYVIDNQLQDQYAPIQAGDKCKRLFLITPNKFNSNIIAFTNDSFVKELDGLIDYDTNFEKNFMKPLNIMVDSLKYNLNKETADLDDW